MKKLILILLLSTLPLFAADVYYARCDSAGAIKASWVQDDSEEVRSSTANSITFEITQAEYEGSILQASINAAIASQSSAEKDFSVKFDKLLKAFALVILDEINVLRADAALPARTQAQLKNAVETKYDSL